LDLGHLTFKLIWVPIKFTSQAFFMKRLLQIGCGMLFIVQVMGQLAHNPVSEEYILSGTFSVHFNNAFSFNADPACLGGIKEIQGGLLMERKWMLRELAVYKMAVTFPAGQGGIGIGFQYSGDPDYNEQSIHLAYGKKLGRLELGICFDYLLNHAAGYSSIGFGGAGFGILYHVTEKLIAGWAFSLPVFGTVEKTHPETGPQKYLVGLGYETTTDLLLSLQLVKISGVAVGIIPAVEYHFADQFLFSFGFSAGNGSLYFNSGWKKNRCWIQLYTAYDQVLGFSPGIVLLLNGKNKKG